MKPFITKVNSYKGVVQTALMLWLENDTRDDKDFVFDEDVFEVLDVQDIKILKDAAQALDLKNLEAQCAVALSISNFD